MTKSDCKRLRDDIVTASRKIRWDPYQKPFKPADLKLNASDYGSFSDHCEKYSTTSSEWCGCGTLRCVESTAKGKPLRYTLTDG
jgi:hypothetical protein